MGWLYGCGGSLAETDAGPPSAIANPVISPVAAPNDGAPDAQSWRVVLSISGGIAGEQLELEVESSGRFVARDLRRGQEAGGILGANQLISLERAVLASREPTTTSRPPACPDCFNYGMLLEIGEGRYVSALNDLTLVNSPLEPLIRQLIQLKDEAFSKEGFGS